MAQQAEFNLMHAPADLEHLYRQMLYIRHFEEKTLVAFRQGKAGGYLHVYSGMEALCCGWLNVIRQGYDYVITAYRDHGHAIVLGTDPVAVMAEIMGRKGGTSAGKGGSMHLYDIKRGFFGGWGIVGGHNALGAGLALAAKYRGEDRVTLCYLGDGASNAGVFFETLNMAALWQLPIVFIIENNFYAMGTALERHAADPDLSKRGIPFGIPHERLDSQDLLQVMKDAERIVEHVRTKGGPYLVEALCYRFEGHGAADHDRGLYRSKEEEQEWLKRDPIKLLEKHFEENNLMTREKMEAIDEEMRDAAERVYAEADAMPHPDPAEVYDNVYSDMGPEVGH
ncbi:MAG: pyruvate dehydrogenase (acetyl-transferring) E1 component subunit alpha [Armatimonadetes bacterium]|nr:pyruvate dehydrogenase (acetyl-transferring) E1 component subunit alpha [Armatimonadota bacterium]